MSIDFTIAAFDDLGDWKTGTGCTETKSTGPCSDQFFASLPGTIYISEWRRTNATQQTRYQICIKIYIKVTNISVCKSEILVIFIYIFIHIWYLVCCVALVLLHSLIHQCRYVYIPSKSLLPAKSQAVMESDFLPLIAKYLFSDWFLDWSKWA